MLPTPSQARPLRSKREGPGRPGRVVLTAYWICDPLCRSNGSRWPPMRPRHERWPSKVYALPASLRLTRRGAVSGFRHRTAHHRRRIASPASATLPTTAFYVRWRGYQSLPVPGSTVSVATGINAAGLIVGVYVDLAGVGRGFAIVPAPSATWTSPAPSRNQAISVNDVGQIVGDYFDAAGIEHGFVSNGGTFTAIDFRVAGATEDRRRRDQHCRRHRRTVVRCGRGLATASSRRGCSHRSTFPLFQHDRVRHQQHRRDRRPLHQRLGQQYSRFRLRRWRR